MRYLPPRVEVYREGRVVRTVRAKTPAHAQALAHQMNRFYDKLREQGSTGTAARNHALAVW